MKFLFIHIAKTAGTSINSLFQKSFGPHQCLIHVESESIWIDDVARPEALAQKRYVSGHRTFADFHKKLSLDDYFTFTFLRDPAAHVVSHLAWIQRLAEDGERERFLAHPEYIQKLALKLAHTDYSDSSSVRFFVENLAPAERALLDNPQVRYLRTSIEGLVSASDVEDAERNLNSLSFVGCVENFSSDFRHLCKLAGLKVLDDVPRENARTDKVAGLSKNNKILMDGLWPLICFDSELYQRVVSLKLSRNASSEPEAEEGVVARIDECTSTRVFGWARRGLSEESVSLDIYVDGRWIGVAEANGYRKDLKEKFGLDCAFWFEFSEPVESAKIVSVKLSATQEDIVNSPYYLGCH